MPVASACPDAQTLQQLALGRLPPEEVERLAGHCEQCERCTQALQALPPRDTLVEALAAQATVGDAPPGEAVTALIERLKARRPAAAATDTAATLPGRPNAGPPPAPTGDEPTGELYDFLAPPQGPGELGRLGPYRVTAVLGFGGMGVVFRAEDPQLRRAVALKAVRPGMAASASARKRFLREAQITASLEHDHIVPIYQVGEDRGVPYLAMPLLRGESLDDRLKREGRLPPAEVLRIGREVAEALAAAHEQGLIHRDIKPGNVWLESRKGEPGASALGGRVRVLDFGLARAAADDQHLTQTGAVVGTPAYLAPEQARGEAADARSDLFSLGCLLYRMATGALPFQGKDTMSTLLALTMQDPTPPRELNPDLAPALNDLILRLLAKDRDQRPGSARVVVRMIVEMEAGVPPAAPAEPPPPGKGMPPGPPSPGAGTPARPRRLLALLGAAAVVGLGAALLAHQIVIRIRDRHGQVTEIKVPEGASVEVDRGGEVVKVPAGDPSKAPPGRADADAAKPFVLTRAGKEQRAFAGLAGVLAEQQPGDVIEVRGKGPFRLGSVEIGAAGLNLRAGPGYRPELVFTDGLDLHGGPLQVDGCDLRFTHYRRRISGDGPWELRNCRLLAASGVVYSGPRCTLTDCLVYVNSAISLQARAELDLTNCLVESGAPWLVGLEPPGGQTVRVRQTTCLAGAYGGSGFFLSVREGADPVTVEVTGSLFQLWGSLGGGLVDGPAARDQLRWQGRDNLYAGNVASLPAAEGQQPLRGLAAWEKIRRKPEEGSREVERLLFEWDRVSLQDAPAALQALREGIAPLRERHHLDDLGPDWDLVGPGDAYVRALAAAGRPVAREDVRPEAVEGGPFVLRHGDKVLRGYPTLAEADAAAGDGDTIEVRTDRPFPGPGLKGTERALTIRAAPGYRPVCEGRLLLAGKERLTLEGLCFRKGFVQGRWVPNQGILNEGHVVRLANCSFEDTPLGWSKGTFDWAVNVRFQGEEGRPAEVVNCRCDRGVSALLDGKGGLAVRNSVVPTMEFWRHDNGEARVELDRCAVWTPDPLWGFPLHNFQVHDNQIAYVARRTLFEVNGLLIGEPRGGLSWTGSRNVYRVQSPLWDWRPELSGLEDWRRHWHSDADSVEDVPLAHDPLQWRLLPQSPGYRQGPGGKDFGADVTRVAPSRPTGER
jgi:hypothetical protein